MTINLSPTVHRGWTITYRPTAPVTGQWRATRFGVGLCANTRELLCRMIDAKVSELSGRII